MLIMWLLILKYGLKTADPVKLEIPTIVYDQKTNEQNRYRKYSQRCAAYHTHPQKERGDLLAYPFCVYLCTLASSGMDAASVEAVTD